MSDKIIELLVLFAIAGFVLFRLRSVIGTRTGYEAPPKAGPRASAPDRRAPDVPDLDEDHDEDAAEAQDDREDPRAQALPEATRTALAAMRKAEPSFSLPVFLGGARGAYEMILMAYESGDRDTLRDLLSAEVFEAFDQVITQREVAGLRVDARFVGLRDVRLESAGFDDATGEADLTIRFVGELITAVHDAENRIVEGDPNEVRRQTDIWTFSRHMGARNPNWLLSATGA